MPHEFPTPDDAEMQAPWGTSGKAVASVVLGIGSLLGSIFTGIPAILLGITSLREITRSDGRLTGRGLAIAGIILSVFCTTVQFLFFLAVRVEKAHLARSTLNLMEINHATNVLIDYDRVASESPGAKNSRNLSSVSWRIRLLSYLDHDDIYRRYQMNQPWNSEPNLLVLDETIPEYHNPNDSNPQSNETNYLAMAGRGTFVGLGGGSNFPLRKPPQETILFVEANAECAVPWTEPKDLDYDPAVPLRGVGGYRPQGILAAFADGSVRALPHDIDPQIFRAMVSPEEKGKGRMQPESFPASGADR